MAKIQVRWGILGAAAIAKRAVIPGIAGSTTGELFAIASRDGVSARRMAEEFSIPKWYQGYEALLADPDVDAVYIPLPNHLHREWTMRAAEAGKHVLCEKPAALNAAQAQEMVQACERYQVRFAEAFMYRYHPRYRALKGILASGEIGELRGIHATFTFNNAGDRDNIRYRQAMGGGALYDVGCYPISAARLILEQEPVAATVHALLSPEHDGVDMMASGLMEFPDAVALTFDCGMWAAGRNTLEVLGTLGRIEVPFAFLGDAAFTVVVGRDRRIETFPVLNPYSLQADDIGRSILYDEPLSFPPADAIRNMDALDAALASARQSTRVTVARTVLTERQR